MVWLSAHKSEELHARHFNAITVSLEMDGLSDDDCG